MRAPCGSSREAVIHTGVRPPVGEAVLGSYMLLKAILHLYSSMNTSKLFGFPKLNIGVMPLWFVIDLVMKG